jgi:hypothetical protein
MKFATRLLIALFVLALAVPAFADDQEKAQKEIKKITAISTDANMRSVVNLSMSELLNAKRLDLVKERQDMNLNYGGLFLAHQLVAGGAKMDDIATQLKAGKNIFDIANDQHANWKQINDTAKKANKKIDDNMGKWFQNNKKQAERDTADDYVAQQDRVAADNDVSKQEMADAQSRYQHVHDIIGAQLPTGDANTRANGPGNMGSPVSQTPSGGRH